MSKRTRIRIMLAAFAGALLLVHLMVWASTWPHHRGDAWILAGLVDMVVLASAGIAATPPEWMP